jgi:hypothetical protein
MKDIEDVDFSQGSDHNNAGVIVEEKGEYGLSNQIQCQNAKIKMFDSSLINIIMLTIEHFLLKDKDFMINT